MKRKLEVFHEGEVVPRKPGGTQEEIAVSEKAQAALEKLFRAVEEEGKTPYLIFDLDGVAIPWGVESPFNRKTLDEHVTENRALVDTFNRRIISLTGRGFRTMIATGRPMHFAKSAVRHLFPPNSVETIVAENGAVLAKQEGEKDVTEGTNFYPKYLDQRKLEQFRARCAPIIAFCENVLRGAESVEERKEIGITLIPQNPEALSPEALREFHRRIMQEADREGLTHDVAISPSAGSVDVSPLGATKARGVDEILGDNGVGVYFGDSSSDEEAMSKAAVNVVPGNAFASTKEQAQKAEIGLIAERQDMAGVVDALSTIEAYMRLKNIKKRKIDMEK